MASLDRKVTVICLQKQIQDTLQHYCFERQMVPLWHLYTKEQKIQINEEVPATLGQIKNDDISICDFLAIFGHVRCQ